MTSNFILQPWPLFYLWKSGHKTMIFLQCFAICTEVMECVSVLLLEKLSFQINNAHHCKLCMSFPWLFYNLFFHLPLSQITPSPRMLAESNTEGMQLWWKQTQKSKLAFVGDILYYLAVFFLMTQSPGHWADKHQAWWHLQHQSSGNKFFGGSSLHQKLQGIFCFLCVMWHRRRKKIIRHWILLELPRYCYISKTVTSQKQTILSEVFVSAFSVSAAAKKAAWEI